jgi:hypothetical protein
MNRQKEFDLQVDNHCAKMIEAYRSLLNQSYIQPSTSHHEELICSTSVENIVSFLLQVLFLS